MTRKDGANVLIVGLGNPIIMYDKTRHNIGRDVICAFGKERGWEFKSSFRLSGMVAKGFYHEVNCYLLLPTTYMNNSGLSVAKALTSFGVNIDSLLVVSDDIFTEFGKIRLRVSGSSGGHNGLKSVAEHIGSENFNRLKIGIGNKYTCSLEDHVLGQFKEDELKYVPEIINKALVVIDYWIEGDICKGVRFANDVVIVNPPV